jgi:hypothetical protein
MSREKRTPQEMAAAVVEAAFESIASTTLAFLQGTAAQPNFYDDYELIEDALYREDNRGKLDECDDVAMLWRLAGREAGYLIGVQVGMRLRNTGTRNTGT